MESKQPLWENMMSYDIVIDYWNFFVLLNYNISEQVLNPQKGVSGTHSFKLIHIYIATMVNSWRSEVGSVDGLQNSTLGLVFGLQYSNLGWVVRLEYSYLGWIVRLQY